MSRQGLKARRLQIGGECLRGHELVGDNISWRPGRKEGDKYIVCLRCQADRNAAEYRRRSPERRAEIRERQNRARLEAAVVEHEPGDLDIVAKWKKYQDSRVAPHNSLAAKAPEEFGELNEKLDRTRGLCFGNPDPWDGYDDSRFPEESTGNPQPTAEEAEALCADCPVLVACKRWAEAEKPAWGVAGGLVWLDGKVVA